MSPVVVSEASSLLFGYKEIPTVKRLREDGVSRVDAETGNCPFTFARYNLVSFAKL